MKIAIRMGDADAKRQAEEALKDHQAIATQVAVGYGPKMNGLRRVVLLRALAR